MKIGFDNSVMSSMMLFLDNIICDKAQGYTNYTGIFYNTNNLYNGLYTYSLPFKQIVADNSVSGANVLSGIYVNNNFSLVGQNGLSGINHQNGQIYLNSGYINSNLSGKYAIKDFNVYLTSQPEEKILFESQYKIRPKTSQNPTGLATNDTTYPAIFIKNSNSTNEAFSFGRTVDSKIDIRVIVMADNLYNLDSICSYLRDTVYTFVPLINNSDLKLNYLGSPLNGSYNYNSIKTGRLATGESLYIEEVNVSKNFNYTDKINSNIYPAFVDFTLSKIRKY